MRPSRTLTRVLATALATTVLVVLGALPAAADLPDSRIFGSGIEEYPGAEPQERCRPRNDRPGVVRLRDMVLELYPDTRDGGIVRACHLGGPSLHKEGRAWDWMVDATDEEQAEMADELLTWLLETDEHGNEHAMARRLGVLYVIWDRRIWSATQAEEGWRPYNGWSPHTDHVHIGLSRDGAMGETSFWSPPEEPAATEERSGQRVGPLRPVDMEDWLGMLLGDRLGLQGADRS